MTVTAPPRIPRRPSDPVTHGEFDALVEALIEEARQRGRRRRRRNAAIVTLVALVGVALFALLGRSAQSQTASPALAARSGPAAGAASSQIAFMTSALKARLPNGRGLIERVLYVMNADGSGKRRLLATLSKEQTLGLEGFVWSPDGRELAFDRGGVYVIKADGSGQRRLARNAGWHASGPAWSPDGRTIAFSRDDGRDFTPGLFVMNADGSGQRRVTQDSGSWGSPAWSPDGRRIAFAGVIGGVGWVDVFVVNVDGSGQRNLTRNARGDSPAWSPDGQTIAFMRYVPNPHRAKGIGKWRKELWIMSADGSGQRMLAELSNSDGLFSSSWSPDGRRIAFVSDRDGNDEIYVINADGSGLRNLTRNPGWDGRPVWSPDGRTIGFVSGRGGNCDKHTRKTGRGFNCDVYVMNADGSGQRNLTRGIRPGVVDLAWSPSPKG